MSRCAKLVETNPGRLVTVVVAKGGSVRYYSLTRVNMYTGLFKFLFVKIKKYPSTLQLQKRCVNYNKSLSKILFFFL